MAPPATFVDHAAAPLRPPVRASLTTLPTELKRMVVDLVAQGDEQDFDAVHRDAPSWREELSDVRLGTGMRAISLLCTEFAALAQPHLWKALHLAELDLSDLVCLIFNIIPRHGRHVKAIRFYPDGARPSYGLCGNEWAQDFAGSHADLVEATLGAPLLDSAPDLEGDRDQHDAAYELQETLLIARVISSLPNLSKVRCNLAEYRDAVDAGSAFDDSAPGKEQTNAGSSVACGEITQALVALNSRLSDLGIFGMRSPSTLNEGEVATFLSHFPLLSRLTLSHSFVLCEGRQELIAILSSLTRLNYLRIKDPTLVSSAFAAAPWTCPLETLSLSCSTLSYRSLIQLLANFSATLGTLSLNSKGLTGKGSSCRGTPFTTPRLHTLFLLNRYTSDLLSLFALCPLKYLTVGDCGQVHWNEWDAFIHSHAATLQRVSLTGTGWYGPGAPGLLRRMRELCESYGIEVEVETEPEEFCYPSIWRDEDSAERDEDATDGEDVEDPPDIVEASEEGEESFDDLGEEAGSENDAVSVRDRSDDTESSERKEIANEGLLG